MMREPGRRLKILLLTWDYPPAHGGIQLWMYELAKRLPNADVTVLAPAALGDDQFDRVTGVRVVRLKSARFGLKVWLPHLMVTTLAHAMSSRPDLIVCGHVVTAPAARVTKALMGIPYAVFTHAFEIRRKKRRSIVTQMLRDASVVIANSRFTADSVRSHGVAPERLRILHPGADPSESHGVTPDSVSASADQTLLSVARLVDLYKGIDTVIRALPLIHAKCANTQYVIVGGGPLRDYLQRLASSLGVERHVVFMGEIDDRVLSELYRTCDVFVQLSREARTGGGAEGFGIACLEASAAGKPVIAGRSGGLPDAVSEGVTGVLVDPTDIGAVAEGILSLLRDPAARDRMGREGLARVRREFTWDQMARKAHLVFTDAVASP